MPQPVTCSRCGRVADAFGGTMTRGYDGYDNTGEWHCTLHHRCEARVRDRDAKELARELRP